MARIKSKDTSIELKVRKYLFAQGFRFRKNVGTLPGKPDIVLPKYKTVIFVHGCYWHRHPFCYNATTPKTRTEFWNDKFQKNTENDQRHKDALESAGWQVLIIWECEIEDHFDETMKSVLAHLERPV